MEPTYEISPLINFFPQNISWQGLPPVDYTEGWLRINESASPIATVNEGDYGIHYSTVGGIKIISLSVHNLWKLSLQDPDHNAGDSIAVSFWQNAVRWLAITEEEDMFRVTTDKTVYSTGESIEFEFELYDERYMPVKNTALQLEIDSPLGKIQKETTTKQDGRNLTNMRFYDDGRYRYSAQALVGADTMKASGEFTVELYSPESMDRVMREDILQGIADISRGRFYTANDFYRFFEDCIPRMVREESENKIIFFPEWSMLLLLLILLAAEWTIRKRKGLLLQKLCILFKFF